MPLYTRFSGAVCRILRRWVEGFSVAPEFARKSYRLDGGFASEESKQGEFIAEFFMQRVSMETSMKSDGKTGHETDYLSESGSVDAGKNDGSDGTELVNEKGEEEAIKRLGLDEWSIETKHETEKDEKADAVEKSTTRRHHCSCCHAVEPQAKLYKKCAL